MKIRVSMLLAVAGLVLSATAAQAFPTWMGVYGDFKRHNGENPGTFTILMNRDYFGLNAEVGIRVNDGAWYTVPMAYAGHVSGNSRWTVTPPQPFPAGAKVSYYFHGWDNSGKHIWDSAGGANYSFDVPSSGTVALTFDNGREIPVLTHSVEQAGVYYALIREENRLLLRKSDLPSGEFSSPVEIANAELYHSSFVSVRDARVAVVYSDGPFHHRIRISENGGATFGPIRTIPIDGRPLAINWAPNGDVIVLAAASESTGALHLFSKKSSSAGEAWSDVSTIAHFPASTMFSSLTARLDANTNGLYVGYSFSEVDSRQFGSGKLYVANSSGGLGWTSELLGTFDIVRGNTLNFDVLATSNGAYLAASTTPRTAPNASGAPRVWRRHNAGWQWVDLPGTGSAERVYIEEGAGGVIAVFEVGFYSQGKCYVSSNRGASFNAPQSFDPPASAGSNRQLYRVNGSRTGIYLAWLAFDMNNGHQPFMVLQRANTVLVQPLQSVGPSYHWPFNGELKSGDNLWINTETRPAHAAAKVRVVYSQDGQYWNSSDLVRHDSLSDRDVWHVDLGSFFAGGSTIRYAVEAVDLNGNSIWDNNGGQDYTAVVEGGHRVPVEWIGATYHWPHNGQINAGQSVWINTDTWPRNTPADVYVVFSINGGGWGSQRMDMGDPNGNNEHWYYNLGVFPAGTTIRYVVVVFDSFGNELWDSNNGQDYFLHVNN
ncbi:MAG TPA: hypothetical protein PJ991_08850 [Kiritimatiellia bacterium]|nr:hypothetical protein [Kiritimatiellia bacterium]